MSRWIVPISIFLSLLLCAGLGAEFIDGSGKEERHFDVGIDDVHSISDSLAPIYTEYLTRSYEPGSVFDTEHYLKSSAINSSSMSKLGKMDLLYELTMKKMDAKYGYPRGPVIGYGYDLLGSVNVEFLEGTNVDNKTYDAINSIIQTNARKIGIDNPPVNFYCIPMPG